MVSADSRRGFFRRIVDVFRPSTPERNPFGISVERNWSVSGEPALINGNSPAEYNKAYARVPYLFACVNAIAEDCASYGWRVLIDDEPLPKPWPPELSAFVTPNAYQTWHDLRYILFVDLRLHGECFCYWSGSRFMWLPAFLTRPIPDPVSGVAGYVMESQGRKIEFNVDEVIHAAIPGPGLIIDGMSSLDPLTDTIRKFGYEVAYEQALFKNNATPSGVLEHPGSLTPEQKDEAVRAWERRHAGAAKASRVALLTHGVKFTAMSMTSKDAGLNDAKEYDRREIQAVFGVPDTRIAQKGINYATATTEMFMYRLSVVFPLCDRMDAAFNRIVAPSGGLVLQSDRTGDYWITAQRREMYETAARATSGQPVATQNEVRANLLNLPLVDDPEADQLHPITRAQRWEQAARMTGWRQVLTQNEAREMCGLGPHDDVEADEVNKAPPQFFPALGLTPGREDKADAIQEIAAAGASPSTEHAPHGDVDLRHYPEWKRDVLTREWGLRVARHYSSVERERGICKKVLALPLIEHVRDEVMRAVNERVEQAKKVLRETGQEMPPSDSMPELPAANRFDEWLTGTAREYYAGALKRVGTAEFNALKRQKRALRGDGIETRADDGLDDAFNLYDQAVTELLDARTQQIVKVPRSMLDDLHKMISSQLEEGETILDVSENLTEHFDNLYEWEATRIARTEAGTAANGATWEAMRQTHVATKRWLQASVGQKKRLTHTMCMDEGEIPFMQRYAANGMMHPQEDGAEAGEVVNCMCVLVAESFDD